MSRQLSQRFGIKSADWQIFLIDTTKTNGHPKAKITVGAFEVKVMENSKVTFNSMEPTTAIDCPIPYTPPAASNPDGTPSSTLLSGFKYENKFYPINGWVAYSKTPYHDELMAGVRIYCRGKFAAQTTIFGQKSGFTGEHNIRSYLIGELHADWLDESEDLIQTDRRDILWSHELGEQFQEWGQKVIKYVGQISRDPLRKTMQLQFFETGDVENKIKEAYPTENQTELRKTAIKLAESFGKSIRGDELSDSKAVEDMVDLCILLAPIQNLDEQLRQASSVDLTTLGQINHIMKTARLAETVTFGHQVEKRLEIIEHLEALKDKEGTVEAELQQLIQTAPWLVNPQWLPITANQSLKTLKKELQKYIKTKSGKDVCLSDFSEPAKKPDFVVFSQDNILQLIEIKKPNHYINNIEWDRIQIYFDQMEAFFSDSSHKEFFSIAKDFHMTLICEGEKLTGAHKQAFINYTEKNKLTHINWASFLMGTTRVHQEFLDQTEYIKSLR